MAAGPDVPCVRISCVCTLCVCASKGHQPHSSTSLMGEGANKKLQPCQRWAESGRVSFYLSRRRTTLCDFDEMSFVRVDVYEIGSRYRAGGDFGVFFRQRTHQLDSSRILHATRRSNNNEPSSMLSEKVRAHWRRTKRERVNLFN